MSEPLRTERADAGSGTEVRRAARIEQLLLAGLDLYFAGRYEEAIDTWTRVAFFERGHGRARAYIERARSALAERQRESEELLHNGVAAYQAGDRQAARDLLTRALEQGGASDTALDFLQRLSRLDGVASSAGPGWSPSFRRTPRRSGTDNREARSHWLITLGASLGVAALIGLAALPVSTWLSEPVVGAPAVNTAAAEPLPVVTGGEVRLRHARSLIVSGRPREALQVLEGVGAGDAFLREAEQLRVDVQRALLAEVDDLETAPGRDR